MRKRGETMILKKIYYELTVIRKELQAIRSSLEPQKDEMSEAEIAYRSLTNRERQVVNWALSLENDSEALKTIKKLSLSKRSDNIT